MPRAPGGTPTGVWKHAELGAKVVRQRMEQALLCDAIERVAARHNTDVQTVISDLDRRVRRRDGRRGSDVRIVQVVPNERRLVVAAATSPVAVPMVIPAQHPWWRRAAYPAVICLVAVAIAELVVVLMNPALGVAAHATIVTTLLAYGATGDDIPIRRLALCAVIAPIIRISSLALPLGAFGEVWGFGLASLPLLVAALVLVRVLGLSRDQIAVQLPPWRHWPATLLVVSSGIPLGWAEYRILRPEPLVGWGTISGIATASIILVIATGFTEELLFRGILQASAIEALGLIPGLMFVSLLFGALHIGYRSAIDVAFVIGVALYFGAIVRWTGTLLGVTLAHGLTNIVLFVVLPLSSARLPLG